MHTLSESISSLLSNDMQFMSFCGVPSFRLYSLLFLASISIQARSTDQGEDETHSLLWPFLNTNHFLVSL